MSEAYEYGEDDFEDEIPDEDDEMRRAILEAEANEIWQEEPGDEDDEAQLPMNPLFGMFPFTGGINIPGNSEKDEDHEDSGN